MYRLIDTRTGQVIRSYTDRKAARRRRDRLDAQYGAVRYVVKPV